MVHAMENSSAGVIIKCSPIEARERTMADSHSLSYCITKGDGKDMHLSVVPFTLGDKDTESHVDGETLLSPDDHPRETERVG